MCSNTDKKTNRFANLYDVLWRFFYFKYIQEATIARESTNASVRGEDGPRINEEIRVREVRLIDETGENRGIVSIQEALRIADEAGLDLIEISPQATPPVCKVLDFGKYKYW